MPGPTQYLMSTDCFLKITDYVDAVRKFTNATSALSKLPGQTDKWNVEIGQLDTLGDQVSSAENALTHCDASNLLGGG